MITAEMRAPETRAAVLPGLCREGNGWRTKHTLLNRCYETLKPRYHRRRTLAGDTNAFSPFGKNSRKDEVDHY